MRYHVCIALPARLARDVSAAADPIPGQPPSIPHITLVGPGKLDRADRELEFVHSLRAAVQNLTPCPVTYDGVAYSGRKEYFYVLVPLTPWLALWHDICVRAVQAFFEPAPAANARFHPHITLAARLPEEHGEILWENVKNRQLRDLFLCRQFLVMRQSSPEAPWSSIARLRLGRAHFDRGRAASSRNLPPG